MEKATMAEAKQSRKKIIVLDIDGGGVLGLIPVYVLKKLEELAGKNCTEIFHAFSGVSAGAIIVGALNMPGEGSRGFKYNATSLTKIYPTFVAKVFQRGLLYKIRSLWGLIAPVYDGKAKDLAMEEFFGEVKMSQLKHLVAISATDFNDPSGIAFGVDRYFHFGVLYKGVDFYLKDTVNASSAAPVFFPSIVVTSIDGSKSWNLVDGGVTTNTQSLTNVVAYTKIEPDAEIHMLSLGTHQPFITKYIKRANWGILKWGTKISGLGISGTTRISIEVVEFLSKELPNMKQFIRLSPVVPPYLDSSFNAESKYLASVAEFAEKYANECAPQLQKFLNGIQGV